MTELRGRSSARPLLVIIMLLVAFGAGFLVRGTMLEAQESNPAPRASSTSATVTAEPVVETPATKDAAAMQNAFAEVAKVAEPAVVTITTRRAPQPPPGAGRPAPPTGPGGQDPFEEFFRRFRDFGPSPNSAPMPQPDTHLREVQQGGGLGSGLIYRDDGLIMTNAHVVRGADTVTVRLSDGREFKNAKVLGQDERTDVAVVKINATKLPVVKLGDSSQVRVGDWAIAVGNPFGLEHTLTVGVISAKAREVPLNVRSPGDYLQTDASINPGNSGGPLLDIYGRVIGVNNAIFSQSGGNIGIGFAIPINTARQVADALVKEGRVRRAYLGASINNLENRAAAFGLDPNTKGVLIEAISPNSPGARAGLQPGDVVTEFNGKAVTRTAELQRMVSSAEIGSTAQLKILRGGKPLTISVRLEELKENVGANPSTPASPNDGEGIAPTALGLRLSTITPQLANRFGIKGNQGIVVVGVEPNSSAAGAGLRPGDVIERVGQTTVTTPQAVQTAVQSIIGKQSGDDKSVALYVNRRGEKRYVVVGVDK